MVSYKKGCNVIGKKKMTYENDENHVLYGDYAPGLRKIMIVLYNKHCYSKWTQYINYYMIIYLYYKR